MTVILEHNARATCNSLFAQLMVLQAHSTMCSAVAENTLRLNPESTARLLGLPQTVLWCPADTRSFCWKLPAGLSELTQCAVVDDDCAFRYT